MIEILAEGCRVAQKHFRVLFVIALMSLTGCTVTGLNRQIDDSESTTIEYSMLPPPKQVINPEVVAEVRRFTQIDRRFIGKAIERGADIIPDIVSELENHGVHRDLLNLAIIESGLKTDARSHMGAVGVWQFIKGTAKVYGLEVSVFQDERKNHLLATKAAARHLRDLYRAFNDWPLALAAYNAGPAAVDRAIQRYGTRDFWKLCRRGAFRRETRRYVPRFFAVKLIRSTDSSV
jgi:membrane-bound lytic murein transglycosylase D